LNFTPSVFIESQLGHLIVAEVVSVNQMLNDAGQTSFIEAKFGIDKSFENRDLYEDLSFKLVKRVFTTWGVDYTLSLKEKMVYESVVHPINNP